MRDVQYSRAVNVLVVYAARRETFINVYEIDENNIRRINLTNVK